MRGTKVRFRASSLDPGYSRAGRRRDPVQDPRSRLALASARFPRPLVCFPNSGEVRGGVASPNLRRRGVAPLAFSSLRVSGGNTPGSVLASSPDRASCRTPPAPGPTHPLRRGTVPPRVTARSLRGGRAGCCLLSGAGGSSRHSPAPAGKPQLGAAEARCSQWGLRRWAGWRLSPSQGRELGGPERAG